MPPTLQERFEALYAKPEPPAAAAPASALGGVIAAPPQTQIERFAGMYPQPRPAAPQRSPAHAPRLTAEQQRAVRDALHSRTSLTQRMTAMLSGPSSATIPQSFELATYRQKVGLAGVGDSVARRM